MAKTLHQDLNNLLLLDYRDIKGLLQLHDSKQQKQQPSIMPLM